MEQQSIEKAPIQYFRLDQLYLSPMNPREGVDAEVRDACRAAPALHGIRARPTRWRI